MHNEPNNLHPLPIQNALNLAKYLFIELVNCHFGGSYASQDHMWCVIYPSFNLDIMVPNTSSSRYGHNLAQSNAHNLCLTQGGWHGQGVNELRLGQKNTNLKILGLALVEDAGNPSKLKLTYYYLFIIFNHIIYYFYLKYEKDNERALTFAIF